MQTWNLSEIDVAAHQPAVLQSDGEGRAIVLQLPAGEELQEHRVHERAWLFVVTGRIDISGPGGGATNAGPGFLAVFDPGEDHEVLAVEDSRLLLLLAPWPGEGHPSRTD